MIDGLRMQLLEGLPARVQGMAEALILEWAEAVDAVPQLAAVASREIIDLLRLTPDQRETALRRRWRRGIDTGVVTDGAHPPRPPALAPHTG